LFRESGFSVLDMNNPPVASTHTPRRLSESGLRSVFPSSVRAATSSTSKGWTIASLHP
jgi:hypothetical protein